MSIKPIDYNVMLPKIQDVSSAKYAENIKNRNIVESGFIQQEKDIHKNKNKVMDAEKGNKSKNIGEDNKKRENSSKNKANKKAKNFKEDVNKEAKYNNMGSKIDIRI